MKKNKALKLTLIILIIILLSIISFAGIYVQNKNTMENVLPEYLLSRDFSGYRIVELKVSDDKTTINYDAQGNEIPASDTETEVAKTEEKATNPEEVLTSENYKKAKQIIEKRLVAMQVSDYVIRQNKENGTIILELPENDDTNRVVGQVRSIGKFEIVDKETDEVLMTNDDIEYVRAGYGTTASGTSAVYINFQFNKEGTQKFKDITNKYVQTTVTKQKEETVEEQAKTENVEETEEAAEPETETVTKQIAIKIDDNEILETYFEEEVSNGLLQLSVGSSSNNTTEQLQEYLIQASNLATTLDSGKMPIVYTTSINEFIASSITAEQIKTVIIVSVAILLVALCFVALKYKAKGVLASISIIGYIAVLLLAVRYFNVKISVGGVIAILYSVAISYAVTISILKQKDILKALLKWTIILIPTLIIAITFVFSNILIGTVLFWGIVITLLYHISVTNLLLRN